MQDNILYIKVERAVKQLKKNKSPGADGVRAEMIKEGGETRTRKIHNMCEPIWTEAKIPDEWTKSVLVTIPKKEIY